MITHSCTQGSPEWLALRRGIPTASEFDALISPEWKIRTGQGPETYLYRKIAEKILGFSSNDASSFSMGQGVILEQEAIPFYSFTEDVRIERVGFCTTDDGRVGCSPDGLIGPSGGIEVKCPQPDTHLKYLMEGELPKEYRAQVHGSMYVTGRALWTFLSYSRQFPALIVHVERDDTIQSAIHDALTKFLSKFDVALAKISAMRDAANSMRQSVMINDR